MKSLRYMTHDELSEVMTLLGEPAWRVKQLEEWVRLRRVSRFEDMTNLSKQLRTSLSQSYCLALAQELSSQQSVDGSKKYLLDFTGTAAECVGMPSKDRLSVCVSSQAGCAMGCAFCATGQLGLSRSLSAEEIVEQVAHVENDFQKRVSHVVVMGQGEPFANYSEVLGALRMLNASDFFGIGARHITVSTCGLIPGIIQFSKEPEQFTLAISLHSAIQETRNRLMPGVRRYSLVHLYEALGTYVDNTGRRPSYEYALIEGVNDSAAELAALCDFCRGTLCHVNLITLNHVDGSPFSPAPPEQTQAFVEALSQVGVEVSVRESRGQDIDAACGQLARKRIV